MYVDILFWTSLVCIVTANEGLDDGEGNLAVYRAGMVDCAGRQSVARHGAGVRESAYNMSVYLTLEHDRSVAAVGCAPRFIAQWIRWAIRSAGARREWRGPMSHRSVA